METTTAVRTPPVRLLWKLWGTAVLAAALAGCQRAPEPAAEKLEPSVEPKEEEPPAEPAAAEPLDAPTAAVPGPSVGRLRLPGTIVAVDMRTPGEVLEAAAGVADAVRPGTGSVMKAVIPAAGGFPGFEDVKSALGSRPAMALVLNPKEHTLPVVVIIGAEGEDGVPTLAKALARSTGLEISEQDGVYVIGEGGQSGFVTRSDGWVVFGGTRELLDASVDAMQGGSAPRAPAGGDHLSVHVDVKEVRRVYGAEIEQGLMAARGMLGANPAVAANAMLGRFMQEYVTALDEIVKGFDEAEISIRMSPEAVLVTEAVRPTEGSVFEPLAEKPAGARWTAASVLPADSPLAVCARFDEEALGPLVEELGKGIMRVAGDQAGGVEAEKLLRTSMEAMSGQEAAFAVTGFSGGLSASGVGAASVDFETYRRLQKETVGLTSLFGGFLEAFGFKVKVEHEEDAGRLDGRPVDRVATNMEPAGPNAAATEAAMRRFGGGKASVMEYVGTTEGVVYAVGADADTVRGLLQEAVRRQRDRAASGAAGWPAAGLREFLDKAPPRTWAAGEMRLGAYIAMVLSAMKQALPVAIDASELTGDDPPLAFWVAAEGGRIVARARVPVVSVRNLVAFFAKFAPSAGGAAAPGTEFDFEGEAEEW